MFITPNILFDTFEQLNLPAAVLSQETFGDGLALWPPTTSSYVRRPIYLISAEEARKLSETEIEGRALAVFSPSWPPTIGQPAATRTLVACKFNGTAEELLLQANRRLKRFAYYYEKASEVVTENEPLQNICENLSILVELPVLVLSTRFAVLAQSSRHPRTRSPIWDGFTQASSPIANEGVADLEQKLDTYFLDGNIPFVQREPSGSKVICCGLIQRNATYGYLLVFAEKHSPVEAIRDYSTQFAVHLALRLLVEQTDGQSRGVRATRLFSQALAGSVEDAEALERHAKASHMKFGPYFQLAVFGTPGEDPTITMLQRLAFQLERSSNANLVSESQGCVACLYCSSQEEVIRPTEMASLQRIGQVNTLHVGISRTYENFLDSARMFDQALAAIELGLASNQQGTLFEFSDFTFQYLREILSARENLRTFCHPGVLQLEQHDREHGTELLSTVSTYLECNSSPTVTANTLSIHRSTLDYRLKKAEGIMGVSLANADDHFAVWLSLRLLREP